MMPHAALFNKLVDSRYSNCLAFALGQTEESKNTVDSVYNLDYVDRLRNQIPIAESFVQKAASFGLKVTEVTYLEETDGKVAFLVWGWYPVHKLFGGFEMSDFHVLRRNPDGTYEHKPDWKHPATRTTLEDVMIEYTENFHIFVLE